MRLKDCKDDVEIIIQLEGGEIVLEDLEDYKRFKKFVYEMRTAQGFYGRLYRDILEFEECYDESEFEFPMYL